MNNVLHSVVWGCQSNELMGINASPAIVELNVFNILKCRNCIKLKYLKWKLRDEINLERNKCAVEKLFRSLESWTQLKASNYCAQDNRGTFAETLVRFLEIIFSQFFFAIARQLWSWNIFLNLNFWWNGIRLVHKNGI